MQWKGTRPAHEAASESNTVTPRAHFWTGTLCLSTAGLICGIGVWVLCHLHWTAIANPADPIRTEVRAGVSFALGALCWAGFWSVLVLEGLSYLQRGIGQTIVTRGEKGSELYLFVDPDDAVVCWECPLRLAGHHRDTAAGMLQHVAEHQLAGHCCPGIAREQLDILVARASLQAGR